MRVAFITDIHSNLTAFKEIIESIKKERPDKIVFLGDYITDGINSNTILDMVREYGDYVLLGNREKYMLNIDESKKNYANYRPLYSTYKSLSKSSLKYLENLMSEQLVTFGGVKFLLIHGNGYFSQYYSDEDIYSSCDELMDLYGFDVCVFGHTHVHADFTYKGKRFINPGSAGMPVDSPSYKYLIIDVDKKNISLDLKEFDTSKTFKTFKNELKKSDYYLENFIWCSLILKTVKSSIDYFQIFLDLVDKCLKSKNMEYEEFNKIWEECFEELERKGKSLCKR